MLEAKDGAEMCVRGKRRHFEGTLGVKERLLSVGTIFGLGSCLEYGRHGEMGNHVGVGNQYQAAIVMRVEPVV